MASDFRALDYLRQLQQRRRLREQAAPAYQPYQLKQPTPPPAPGIADYALNFGKQVWDVGAGFLGGVGRFINFPKEAAEYVSRAVAKSDAFAEADAPGSKGLNIPDDWTYGPMLKEALLPSDRARGGLLDYVPEMTSAARTTVATVARALGAHEFARQAEQQNETIRENPYTRGIISGVIGLGGEFLDPLLPLSLAGPAVRGSSVAAKLLQRQQGLGLYAPEVAAALRSAIEKPAVAAGSIAEYAQRLAGHTLPRLPGGAVELTPAMRRLAGFVERAPSLALGVPMAYGGGRSLIETAADAWSAGEVTPEMVTKGVEGLGAAVLGGSLALTAGSRSRQRAEALAGSRAVRPTRVLPIDEVPDPLQQRAERHVREMSKAIASGKAPEEVGILPDELQPYADPIYRQATEEARALREGNDFLERLRSEHQTGEPGISVEEGPTGGTRIIQRDRQGNIVGGAQAEGGTLQFIAGGDAVGSRLSAQPIFDKLDALGITRSEDINELSALGALSRRRRAERQLRLPREVLEGRVTREESVQQAAKARQEFIDAGLRDLVGVPAYAADGAAPHFFSQVRKVVNNPKTQPAQRGGDWLRFLTDPKRGVKAAEMKWSGLDDYLKGRAGERVTREEISRFLDDNEVQVDEVISGETMSHAEALKEVQAGRNVWWADDQSGEPLAERDVLDARSDARFVRGGDGTKHEQWTEPGGTNYRELKITQKKRPGEAATRLARLQGEWRQMMAEFNERYGGEPTLGHLNPADRLRRDELFSQIAEADDTAKKLDFRGGHYDEPNILAHVRFKDDIGPNGEKVLRVEEIQSDWAEVGRDVGFKGSGRSVEAIEADIAAMYAELDKRPGLRGGSRDPMAFDLNPDLLQRWRELDKERAVAKRGLPSAPFVEKTNEWTDLAVKRVMKYAADNGYDKVAWTRGDVQNRRYELEKFVEAIHYDPAEQQLTVYDKHGDIVLDEPAAPGDLPGKIGKEVAGRLLEQELVFDSATETNIHALSGENLKVGGHGMRAYYDEMVPQSFSRVAKKFGGGQVGKLALVGADRYGDLRRQVETDLMQRGFPASETAAAIASNPWVVTRDGVVRDSYPTQERARRAATQRDEVVNIGSETADWHSIDVPQEMRERIKAEGFPLFAVDKAGQAQASKNTRDLLLKLYPDGSHIKETDGLYEVTLPDKRVVTWRPAVDHIEIDTQAFEKGYGEKPTPEQIARGAAGVTRRLPHAAIVEIAKRNQEARVPLHEHWHVLKHLGMLTEKQQQQLKKKYKNEEGEADGFADWWLKEDRPKDTIWQKISSGIQRVYQAVTGAPESVFREVSKDALTKREPTDVVQSNAQRVNLNWHLAASGQGQGRKGAKYSQPPNDANNLRLEREGKPFFIGPLSKDEWLQKAKAWVGEPGSPQWNSARYWYHDLLAEFEKRYGKEEGEKMLTLWGLSQQRASPSEGLQNLLRAEDVVRGFRPETAPKAGLAHDRLIAGLKGLPLSLGQKLADFVDAIHTRTTRQWVGHDPRGGRPAPVDVHAARDVGFVDEVVINAVRKFYGEDVANRLKIDLEAAPKDGQYYAGHRFYNDLADWLNENNVDGGNWSPYEAQAVGWVAQIHMLGGKSEGPKQIFPPSISHVAVEVAPGEGSARSALWSQVPAERQSQVTYNVIRDVWKEASELAGVRILEGADVVGGWEQYTNPNVTFEALNTEGAVRFAKLMARALHQTEVWAQRVSPKSRQNSVGVDIYATPEYDFSKAGDVSRFWGDALANEPGLGFSRVRDNEGVPVVRVVVDNEKAAKKVIAALDKWAGEREVVTKIKPLEVVKSVNDWRLSNAGEGHTSDLRGVEGRALDAFLGRAEESFRRRAQEAVEGRDAGAAEAEGLAPKYAVAAAEPELGQPKPPGEPPRVETRVEGLEDAVREQRQLGIPAENLNLSRMHRRTWKSLDPEVKRLISTWDDQQMLNISKRRQFDDVEVMALDAVVRGRQEAKDLSRLDYIDAKGTPGEDAAWRKYAQALGDYVVLERMNVNDGTGTAQALAARARLMEAAQTKDRSFLRQVFREIPGIDDQAANELLQMFESGDPRLADALRAATVNRWKAYQTLLRSFLITPSSELANTLGNSIVQGVEIADSAAAAGVDWVISKLRGTNRERTIGEVGAEIGGMWEAVPGAVNTFLQERFWNIYKRAWTGETKPIRPGTPLEHQVGPFGRSKLGRLGRLFSTSLDTLQAGDELFQAPVAQGELSKRAYRRAKAQLPPGSDLASVQARALEILAEAVNRPEAHMDLIKEVQSAVDRRLFRDKPWHVVNVIKDMERRWPWMVTVFPFVKTPANIARYAIHHSPLGMFTKEFGQALLTSMGKGDGAMTQGQAADVIARRVTGTVVFAMAVGAAKAGKITGSGPAKEEERRILEQTGWRPYSIVVNTPSGKVYVPYNRFDPVAQMVGVAADIVELPNMRDANDVASKAIGSIAENFTNRTYLKGLVDFTEALNNPLRFAGNYAIGIGEMHIPRQLARIAQAIDPVVRDVRPVNKGVGGFMDRVVASAQRNVPGLSKMLPARYTPTGEELVRPGEGVSGGVMRALSPIQISAEKKGRGLEALMAQIGYVPPEAASYMTIQGQQIHLDREHLELLHRADKGAAYELRRLLLNPMFLRLPDSIEEGGSGSKEGIIRKTYDKHRDLARQEILRSWTFQRSAREQLRAGRES